MQIASQKATGRASHSIHRQSVNPVTADVLDNQEPVVGERLWKGVSGLVTNPHSAEDFIGICNWCSKALKMAESVAIEKGKYEHSTNNPWITSFEQTSQSIHETAVSKLLSELEEHSVELRKFSRIAERYWIQYAQQLATAETELSIDDISDDRYPAVWLLFITMCRTRLAAMECGGPRSVSRAARLTAANFSVPMTAISARPVLQYTTSQLCAAIDSVAHLWNDYCVTWSLVEYVDSLQMCAAIILARDHNEYRMNVAHFSARRPTSAPKIAGSTEEVHDEKTVEKYIARRKFVAELSARFQAFYTAFSTIREFKGQTVDLRDRTSPARTLKKLRDVFVQIENKMRREDLKRLMNSGASMMDADLCGAQNVDLDNLGDMPQMRGAQIDGGELGQNTEDEFRRRLAVDRAEIEKTAELIASRIYAAGDAVGEMLDYLSWWSSSGHGRFIAKQQYFKFVMRGALSPGDEAIYMSRRPSERPDARTILVGLHGRVTSTEAGNMANLEVDKVLANVSARLPGGFERVKTKFVREEEQSRRLDRTKACVTCSTQKKSTEPNVTQIFTGFKLAGLIDPPYFGHSRDVLLTRAITTSHISEKRSETPDNASHRSGGDNDSVSSDTTVHKRRHVQHNREETENESDVMQPRSILSVNEEMAALAAINVILTSTASKTSFEFSTSYIITSERFHTAMADGCFDGNYPLIVVCGNTYDVVYRRWRFHTSCIVESLVLWFQLLPQNASIPVTPRFQDTVALLSGTAEACDLSRVAKIVDACVETALGNVGIREWLNYAKASAAADSDGAIAQIVRFPFYTDADMIAMESGGADDTSTSGEPTSTATLHYVDFIDPRPYT